MERSHTTASGALCARGLLRSTALCVTPRTQRQPYASSHLCLYSDSAELERANTVKRTPRPTPLAWMGRRHRSARIPRPLRQVLHLSLGRLFEWVRRHVPLGARQRYPPNTLQALRRHPPNTRQALRRHLVHSPLVLLVAPASHLRTAPPLRESVRALAVHSARSARGGAWSATSSSSTPSTSMLGGGRCLPPVSTRSTNSCSSFSSPASTSASAPTSAGFSQLTKSGSSLVSQGLSSGSCSSHAELYHFASAFMASSASSPYE
jgi:hypothetical protein